jgi:hypothetical protein
MSDRFQTAPARAGAVVCLTATAAVGGALAMTVLLAPIAILSAMLHGVRPEQAPLLLTADKSFAILCALGGVASAFIAGYITARRKDGTALRHALAAGVLAAAGHAALWNVIGSPLPAQLAAIYIALTVPALVSGWYFGSPAR